MSRLDRALKKWNQSPSSPSKRRYTEEMKKKEEEEEEEDDRFFWGTTPPPPLHQPFSLPSTTTSTRLRNQKKPAVDEKSSAAPTPVELSWKDTANDEEMDKLWNGDETSFFVAPPPPPVQPRRRASSLVYSWNHLPPLPPSCRNHSRDTDMNPYPLVASSSPATFPRTSTLSKVAFQSSTHEYLLVDANHWDGANILTGSKVVSYLKMREEAGGTVDRPPDIDKLHRVLTFLPPDNDDDDVEEETKHPRQKNPIRRALVFVLEDLLCFRLAALEHVFRFVSSPKPLPPILKTYQRAFWFSHLYVFPDRLFRDETLASRQNRVYKMEHCLLETFPAEVWETLERWLSRVNEWREHQVGDAPSPPWTPDTRPEDYDTYMGMQLLLFGADPAWPATSAAGGNTLTKSQQRIVDVIAAHPLRNGGTWTALSHMLFPDTYRATTTTTTTAQLFGFAIGSFSTTSSYVPPNVHGTRMHDVLDFRLKKEIKMMLEASRMVPRDVLDQIDAFFQDWNEKNVTHSELRVGSYRHKICGSLDALYWDEKNEEWMIIDWKRTTVLFGERKNNPVRDRDRYATMDYVTEYPDRPFHELGGFDSVLEPLMPSPAHGLSFGLRSDQVGVSHPIFGYLIQLATYRKLLLLNGWEHVSIFGMLVVFHPLHETYRTIRVNLARPLKRLPDPIHLVECLFALRERDLRASYRM